MNKILEEALKHKVQNRTRVALVSDEEAMEVAFAWLRDEVGISGIAVGMGLSKTSTSDAYLLINRGVRAARRNGKIKIVE